MRPSLWPPPVELSPAEHAISNRIRRATVFVCLRQHRHALFAEAFQQELLTLSKDQPQGQPPSPPAPLALATLLHASTRGSDAEVLEATTMERRWQLVLDGLDCETPPFRKGTLVAFRQHLLAQQWLVACGNGPENLRPPAAPSRGSCGRRWRAARCGGPGVSKRHIIGWATPCARRWVCSRGSRGGGGAQ